MSCIFTYSIKSNLIKKIPKFTFGENFQKRFFFCPFLKSALSFNFCFLYQYLISRGFLYALETRGGRGPLSIIKLDLSSCPSKSLKWKVNLEWTMSFSLRPIQKFWAFFFLPAAFISLKAIFDLLSVLKDDRIKKAQSDT